jgi:eukaryotic-like serine/threonine-protein kinase
MTPQRWARIKEVFGAAFERPEAERTAFLDSACDGDAELRVEVERLLSESDAASLHNPASGFLNAAAELVPGEPVMALQPSTRLGPYEILSLIGAGGMGEVYRARDTRLNREVAIKVLGVGLANDRDRRARFEKEARAVAALNHPNIVSLFDIGTEGDILYTVSELVEGESLRGLLRRGPVPLRKLVDIAVRLTDGMAAAHTLGITHRDLKPENVMVANDGRVKILDFGLARYTDAKLSAPLPEQGTITMHDTKPGTVMGTVNYMSPEQARGVPVDYRSDQFSFGVILYELASGSRAFERETQVHTLAAIISEEPPPIDAKLPPPLLWTIDRCLAKEPVQRYESTRDLYHELQNLQNHLSESFTTGTVAPAKTFPSKRVLQILAGALFVLLATTAWLLFMRDRSPDLLRYRFTPIAMDPDQESPIWSPDGKAVVFAGGGQLFLRYLNSSVATQLTRMKDGALPVAWSSAGKRIFFVSNPSASSTALFSIATVGGEPEFIMAQGQMLPLAISPDGRALVEFRYHADEPSTLAISSPIGSPLRNYSPIASKGIFNAPALRFSPNGKKILLLCNDQGGEKAWLVPFPEGGGSPRLVLKNIPKYGFTPAFSWMPDSRHIVIPVQQSQESTSHLWIADTESDEVRPLTTGTSNESDPAVSPDGRKILYVERQSDYNIVSVSLADGTARNLIATDRSESMAAWSAGRPMLTYVTDRDGAPEIWLRLPDGSDRPIVTANDFPGGTTRFFMNPSLSPEGDRVIFTRIESAGAGLIWIASLSGGSPVRLTNSEGETEFAGSWSPDGKRFTYIRASPGKYALMIVKAGGQATPVKLKDLGAVDELPIWSPTGEWIAHRDNNSWSLISPEGNVSRNLGKIDTPQLTFSKDGKQLYGIREDGDHHFLFSMDLRTLRVKTIRDLAENEPLCAFCPGIRFSVAPDGKSFVYTVGKFKSNIWLFEGFAKPGLFSREGAWW